MKKLQGNKCPLALLGRELHYEKDVLEHRNPRKCSGKVVDIRFDHWTQGTCHAFKCLALVRLDNGDRINPGNASNVNCRQCPVLEKNPGSRKESVSYEDLKQSVLLWSNPNFDKWLNREIQACEESLKEADNDNLRGKSNALHAAKHWLTLLDYEDLVEEIKLYAVCRQHEGVFGQAIRDTCQDVLVHMNILDHEAEHADE